MGIRKVPFPGEEARNSTLRMDLPTDSQGVTSMCDDEDESIDRLDESLVSFGSMEIYGDLWRSVESYLLDLGKL